MDFLFVAGALAACVKAQQFDPSAYAEEDIIERDFAIIGGGAAGTYAAVSLADQNKTFTVVEVTDRLGGNTRTFRDESTGVSVDIGVQLHENITIVRDFFKRLNSPLTAFENSDYGDPKYYDFTQKVPLPNHTRPSLEGDYVVVLNKYPCVNNVNYLPKNVPEELLMTWPEFAKKENLFAGSAGVGMLWPATPGNLLETTAMAIFNDGNQVELAEGEGARVRSATHYKSQIYVNALAELKECRGVSRKDGVRLVAKTPSGRKLIIAKQLIIAMLPVLENTKYFALDQQEQSILSKLSGKHFYAGVVNNTGLETGYAYTNVGKNTLYNAPDVPGVVEIAAATTPGYFFYWYNSVDPQSQGDIEQATRDIIKWLQSETGVEAIEPTFQDFVDFSPFHLSPPTYDIADDWYGKMKDLQGHRNTWYISALFVVGSTHIWNNTRNMLPEIIEAARS
ncbi:hypothetical protein N7488_001462 [Penicillium malachiteum]|nr:hypothetical protein N7488_001462 [Penicillium malachiteum]